MNRPPQVTQEDAIIELVVKSKRLHAVPLRKELLQRKTKPHGKPGLLSVLVRHHDELGLDLYLLLHLVGAGPPHKVALEAGGWARALGLAHASGRATVSRTWKRLAELKLVVRGREARKASITLLREDGSGAPYTRPSGESQARERYLKIPLTYWNDGWYARLSLAAKAMLLIALSLPDRFFLPSERVPQWYGISADTALRGLAELERLGLLEHEDAYKKAPLTTQGWTLDRRYTLRPPFKPGNGLESESVGAEIGAR